MYKYIHCQVSCKIFEGVRRKGAFFISRPSSQDHKSLSDTNKFRTSLPSETLFKQF